MALNSLLQKKTNIPNQTEHISSPPDLLTDLKPHSQAQVLGFDPSISADRKTHLQAYGIIPGNSIRVRQKRPVTIVQIEHTELALEADLAKLIYVTAT